jgi:predicted CoA-binding protein
MHKNPPDDELKTLLTRAQTIAVVGASNNTDRPVYSVMRRLQRVGYHVIPVNPRETEILGEKVYPSLRDIPVHVDIVDVFRRAEATPPIAEDAVAIKAGALWLQQGISNEESARIAKAGGLTVVMDTCIAVEHSLLQVPAKTR